MRTSLILFTASILALSSCQTTEMNNHEGGRLSSTDSLKIIEGVNEALDLYADANNTLDGERITGFWSQSSDLVFIVGNYEYTDWNSIYQACIDFYSSPIDSTNLEWISRNIVPLSRDCASVYGKYKMFLRIPSGEVIMNIAPYFTAVMVKEGEQWKVLRGHESYQ